jgi:hypothetical protein
MRLRKFRDSTLREKGVYCCKNLRSPKLRSTGVEMLKRATLGVCQFEVRRKYGMIKVEPMKPEVLEPQSYEEGYVRKFSSSTFR